jgi:hypothetical protein
MAFIADVATGCGKLTSGVGVPTGTDAVRVQALSVNANTANKISTNFLLIFSSPPKDGRDMCVSGWVS